MVGERHLVASQMAHDDVGGRASSTRHALRTRPSLVKAVAGVIAAHERMSGGPVHERAGRLVANRGDSIRDSTSYTGLKAASAAIVDAFRRPTMASALDSEGRVALDG